MIVLEVQDYELIAQQVSGLGEKISELEERLASVTDRVAAVERVNARLEEAALTTARALVEVSHHWDAVYEAMRRPEGSTFVRPNRS